MLDIKITGGMIIDGTGAPWFRGEIGIKNGMITYVGAAAEAAKEEIRAVNCYVSPGFVDIHTHSEAITEFPEATNFLRQGVTTVVSGNCGSSELPLKTHLDRVRKAAPAINYATLAGLGSIRKQVMDMSRRAPTKRETSEMARLVEKAMKQGAVGISTGLFYVPGEYAKLQELSELAKAAAAYGGFYATHARSAGGKLFEAVREAASIGKRAGIPVQISHLKILHKKNRTRKNRVDEILAMIAEFRARGKDVTFDVHPYPATNTSLYSVIIPPEVSEGGKLLERLRDRSFRKKISSEVAKNIAWIGGADKITVSQFEADTSLEGRTLGEIASSRKKNAVSTAMDLILEGGPVCIFHALRQEDVMKIACSENCIFASDARVVEMGRGAVHPRNYGTFPRFLREYAREKRLLSAEEAVRKMTSFPAGKCGLHDRGIIRPGMAADIAVFSETGFSDTATFERPHSFPTGLKKVIVNGRTAFDGRKTITRAGEVLMKSGPGRKASKKRA